MNRQRSKDSGWRSVAPTVGAVGRLVLKSRREVVLAPVSVSVVGKHNIAVHIGGDAGTTLSTFDWAFEVEISPRVEPTEEELDAYADAYAESTGGRRQKIDQDELAGIVAVLTLHDGGAGS